MVGTGAWSSPLMGKQTPPVNRENLTPAVTHTEHGKPVCFLFLLPCGRGEESQVQVRPIGMRVKDVGGSEGPSVMGGTEVTPSG